tara:strand:- start:28 stop:276 length:249 start_codon:yes stop_codon:yes gene_type:complete
MKIFKLFKEIQAIRDVLTLIFTQQIDLNHKLTTMQAQLDEIQSEPEYEEFEGESEDIKVTSEIYRQMCEYLEEDEIDVMGLT